MNILKKIKELCTNRRFQIICGAVLGVLLIAFIIIFSLPANRARRAFKKANEYYATAEYTKASEYYLKAVTIKAEMFSARKGLILSDSAIDKEKAKADLMETDAAMAGLTAFINENTVPFIVEIYLLTPEIYGNDSPETQVKLLENALTYLPESQDLKPALSDAYKLMANSLIEADIFTAIEYDQKAKDIIQSETGLEKQIVDKLTDTINSYIDSDDYDKAYAAIDSYKSLYGIESAKLAASADAARDLYETKIELFGSLYAVMEEYYQKGVDAFSAEAFDGDSVEIPGMTQFDYSKLFEFDGSDLAEKLATSFTRDAYIYAPNFSGDYKGTVCGLYTYGAPYEDSEGVVRTNYYFYFGEFSNGKRNGYGISFSEASDTAYKGYEGEWKDDAPNGFGTTVTVTGIDEEGNCEYKRVIYGSFENGIQTGTMNVSVTLGAQPEMIFKGSYNVVDGSAEEIPVSTDDYEILDEISEDQKLIAVVPSNSEGYNIYVKILQRRTEILSVLGY